MSTPEKEWQLRDAAGTGDTATVGSLLAAGVNVDATNPVRRSAPTSPGVPAPTARP